MCVIRAARSVCSEHPGVRVTILVPICCIEILSFYSANNILSSQVAARVSTTDNFHIF